jgi:hypothetical protein
MQLVSLTVSGSIAQGRSQASGMAKGEEDLMEVRKARDDDAAVSATADDQATDRPFQELKTNSVCHQCFVSSLFKYWFDVSSSTSVDSGNRPFPARLLSFRRSALSGVHRRLDG